MTFFNTQLRSVFPSCSFLSLRLFLNFVSSCPFSFLSLPLFPEDRALRAVSSITLTSAFVYFVLQVDWPVDVILNTKCIKVYNKIFGFLLQVKRAKYCLDELSFAGTRVLWMFSFKFKFAIEALLQTPRSHFVHFCCRLGKRPRPGRKPARWPRAIWSESETCRQHQQTGTSAQDASFQNETAALRQQLWQFHHDKGSRKIASVVKSWKWSFVEFFSWQIFLFQVLHTTELEFLDQLGRAKDLDQVIASHNHFVATIYDRCLLHHKVRMLKEAIMKILNMTLTFQKWWDQGVSSVRYAICESLRLFSNNTVCMLER